MKFVKIMKFMNIIKKFKFMKFVKLYVHESDVYEICENYKICEFVNF